MDGVYVGTFVVCTVDLFELSPELRSCDSLLGGEDGLKMFMSVLRMVASS